MKIYGRWWQFLTNTFLYTLLIFSINSYAAVTIPTKEPGTLTVCAFSEFEPIIYGEGKGYEADLLRAIGQLWQLNIKFYTENVSDGIWRLPSRGYSRCDIGAGAISPPLNGSQKIATFSITTIPVYQSLLVPRRDYETGRISSYESLKQLGLKIGVLSNSPNAAFAFNQLQKSGINSATLLLFSSVDKLVNALQNQQIAAIAGEDVVNEYLESLYPEFMTIDKQKNDQGYAFAVDITNPSLRTQLNDAIGTITDNGKIGYSDWLRDSSVFTKRVKGMDE